MGTCGLTIGASLKRGVVSLFEFLTLTTFDWSVSLLCVVWCDGVAAEEIIALTR